jgi:hypothetical protein
MRRIDAARAAGQPPELTAGRAPAAGLLTTIVPF